MKFITTMFLVLALAAPACAAQTAQPAPKDLTERELVLEAELLKRQLAPGLERLRALQDEARRRLAEKKEARQWPETGPE